jgi:hypothetical protein
MQMDAQSAIDQIKKSCNAMSVELMRINPAASSLGDKQTTDELFRTVYELTKEVESIKKLIRKLELKRAGESQDLPPEL